MKRLLAIIGEGENGVEYVRFQQPFHYLSEFGYELVTLGRQFTLERGPDGYRPNDALFKGIGGVIFPQLVASPRLADGTQVDLTGGVCRRAFVHGRLERNRP